MAQAAALLLLVTLAVVAANTLRNSDADDWNNYKLSHGKQYQGSVADFLRMKIYEDNQYLIARQNALFAEKKVTYYLGPNEYSDMLHFEFSSILNGFNRCARFGTCEQLQGTPLGGDVRPTPFVFPRLRNNASLPEHMDWRIGGAVTPVKDQGRCGSCWAFSSTGALEGQNFLKTGKLISLSEQNLIDCTTPYGNNGCQGGFMENCFKFTKDNKGINTEDSYPYEASQGSCRFDPLNIGAVNVGYVNIPADSEEALLEAVATVGPVAAAIDASHPNFQLYKGGIFNEASCSSTYLDHAVLVIGYGIENGMKYWLVKNSWGTSWGEEGFGKMARGMGNQCGIAALASYPTF